MFYGQFSLHRIVLNVLYIGTSLLDARLTDLCCTSFWQKRSGGQIKHEKGKWMFMCFTLFVALSTIFSIIKVSLWCKPFATNVVVSFCTNNILHYLMETAILVTIFQECRLFHWEILMAADWSLNGLLLPCILQRAPECSCIVVIYAVYIIDLTR